GKENWFNFVDLNFESEKARIDEETISEVENIYEILKAYPEVDIRIGGYSDNTGSSEFNQKLSADRAEAVKVVLVTKGIAGPRITTEGYGEEHPVASNDTEVGRAQNRRIAVSVRKK
ncbi:MAG: K(+)-stimulated pyrophosphate-energized sodium pump, partial [Spirosomataceae bacterium]